MTRALLVVDIQVDFCEGGALAVTGGNKVASDIADFLNEAGGYSLVIATKDWHIDPGDHFKTWPVHCEALTDGAKFHPALRTYAFDGTVYKGQYDDGYSGFDGSIDGISLDEFLVRQGIEEVDIVGLAYDHCVKATAIDAIQYGFDTRVLTKYTAGVDSDDMRLAAQEMLDYGVRLM